MSSPLVQTRLRVSRAVPDAIRRARLVVVPPARTPRPRAPFAILVLLVLGGGVAGLLLFNTHMQQVSFHISALEREADDLVARQQALDMELARLRDPQSLAAAAKRQGMVPPGAPAFLRLPDGKVLGTPLPARADDGIAINAAPRGKPAALRSDPVIITVPHGTSPGALAGRQGADR